MELKHLKKPFPHLWSCSRRRFITTLPLAVAFGKTRVLSGQGATGVHFSVLEFDRVRMLALADRELTQSVPTLVSASAVDGEAKAHEIRSGRNDPFNSPATEEQAGGFLQQTDLLARMVMRVAALTAAWRLTKEDPYYNAAIRQIRAWCLDASTCMDPTLEHVGTIGSSVDDARVNGITQTVCLAEFARSVAFLCSVPGFDPAEDKALRAWFASLLVWLNESKRGMIARETSDLQAICWTMQAAELARFTRNDAILRECAHRFRDRLLRQMTFDGNFPPALRTKRPYAASMFTLECLASCCESLSTPFESQWNYALPDGRGMRSAVAWAAPYLASRGKWPYVSDSRFFAEQPLRCNALLFAGRAWNRQDYVDLWKTMRPDTITAELKREHPITQPGLWATRPPA